MRDISKSIVAKIKEGHVVPEARFKLQWKSYLFWAAMCVMIFIGALSLSLVIFNFSDINPSFLQYMGLQKFFMILFITAPYLWMALSLSALIFGIMAFRKTTKGYRRSTLFITSLIVLIISILGIFGHILKIDNRMRELLSRGAPNFIDVTNPIGGRWQRPGDGLIAGEVANIESGGFDLKSFNGQNWKITYDSKTEIVDGAQITIGEKVGIIGEKTEEFLMYAFSIKKFPDDWNGEPPRGLMPPSGLGGQFSPGGFMPLPPPDVRMPN